MTDYPKHRAALACAIADLGKHEEPIGSNNGPFVRTCQAATWLAPARPGRKGWPWCRAGVLKWRRQAGDKPGDLSAGAWDAYARARKRGETLPPADWRKAIPGDEITWNIGAGHSSLLERFEMVGGHVLLHSIDANASDQVKRCTRPLAEVRGFIAWPEQGYPAGEKRPLLHIVGSASGTRLLVVAGKSIPLPASKDKVV